MFSNPQFGEIRTAGTPDEPLFCLADVCQSIGISNARNVKSRIDEEDVRQVDTLTNGGIQSITYVTESGLYDVILRSDSPNAKPFRKWVTSEVLPSIRKHGAYLPNLPDFSNPAAAATQGGDFRQKKEKNVSNSIKVLL